MDIDLLKQRLVYEPETGEFIWLKPRIGMVAGAIAGSVNSHGYVVINTGGKTLKAHRLAWWFVYGEEPSGLMDHINGSRADNRIENLRLASAQQNAVNRCVRSDSKSGIKGVSWRASKRKWVAVIVSNGIRRSLGNFASRDDAEAAYKAGALEIHGEFARSDLS